MIGALGVGGYTAIFWLVDSVPCLLLRRRDHRVGWWSLAESCVLAGFVMAGRLFLIGRGRRSLRLPFSSFAS